jgi:hypothetical protein
VDPHFDCAVGRALLAQRSGAGSGGEVQAGTGYVELLGRGAAQTPFVYLVTLLRVLYAPEQTRLEFSSAQGLPGRPNVWVQIRRLRYLTTDDETGVSLPLESFNPQVARSGAPGHEGELAAQLARLQRATRNKLPSAKWIGLTVDFEYGAVASHLRKVLLPLPSPGPGSRAQREEITRVLFGGGPTEIGAAPDSVMVFDGQDLAAATGFSPQLKTAMCDLRGLAAPDPADVLDYGIAETGKNVIIGVVDFGCDFAHPSFRTGVQSRILALWDQNNEPETPFSEPPLVAPESACADIEGEPLAFGYGRVFTRAHIETVLQWQAAHPSRDRQAAYAMLGYSPGHHYYKSPQHRPTPQDPQQAIFDAGHGTLVLDICAGSSRRWCALEGVPEPDRPIVRGMAPDADIVFVQVRTHQQQDGRRVLDANDVIDAVAFVFHLADKTQRDCVVNLSLNTMSGPHDGDGHFERRLASLLRSGRGGADMKGRAAVIAAGNLAYHGCEDRLWQHIADTVPPGRPFEFLWPQPARDPTRNSLEIWYDATDAWLTVTLVSPAHEEFGPVEAGQAAEILRDGEVCGSIIGSRVRPNIRDNATTGKPNDPIELPGGDHAQGRHVILIEMTSDETALEQWTVRLQMTAAPAGAESPAASDGIPFHAWLERDDEGQSGIRRSPANRWILPRDRDATIGTLSCGEDSIVVAAYDTSADATGMWHQSARGPSRRSEKAKPDLSAPGVNVRLALAGSDTGCMRASGTSLAAPFVTGTIACLYEAHRRAPLAAIKDALFQTARKELGGSSFEGWSPALGHGRLYPRGAIEWIKQYPPPGGDDAGPSQ